MKYTCDIRAQDIDKDDDMDVFVADFDAGKILFYENHNFQWAKHIIDGMAGRLVGLDLADFDNDGNVDIIAGCWGADLVAWYKNNGGYPIQWIKDTIDNAHDGPTEVWAKDINGDGATDVVADFNEEGRVFWYENNLPDGWTTHLIGSDVKGSGSSYAADINNDDKPDVVRSVENQDKVVLFKNNLPDNNWTEIIVDGQLGGTFCPHIADIDNDGDKDIAATGGETNIVWYENDGSGQEWTKHPITTDLKSARYLFLIDIDTNGYTDIVVTDRAADNLILLRNEDGGQIWNKYVVDDDCKDPNSVFVYDLDLDDDYDIIPSIKEGDGPLIWYENPLGSAYAISLETSPFSIQSTSDTLIINATMYNPDNHPVNAWVVINGDQSGFVDTLQLFDDGLHSDEEPQDNVWGNYRLTTDFPEDEFAVDLFTYDSTYGDKLGFRSPARFFTLGPVEVERYFPDPDFFCGNTEPTTGGCLNIKLTLKNNSSAATATNISAELVSLDTLISIIKGTSNFAEIPAGDSSISINKYQIYISEQCPGDTMIPIEVIISSYDKVCWHDIFFIHVDTSSTTNVYDVKAPIVRIYPNPANDLLTVETSQPGQQFIEITSLNGQLLYTDRLEGPIHQIDFSSFQKGLYFITIRSRDYVRTEKIIKHNSIK
jgi:hypothetical protein